MNQVMLQQALDMVRNQIKPQFTGIRFSKFALMHGSDHKERTGKLAFLMKDGHCTSVLQLDQGHNYETVG